MQHAVPIADMLALCQTPCALESYSPLLEHNYLLLDLEIGQALFSGQQWAQLATRLGQLPQTGGESRPLLAGK